MDHTAFIFPGQGAQFVGMGKELADAFASARAVFEEVDAALGENFSSLIWEGSDDDLKLTANTQPALMASRLPEGSLPTGTLPVEVSSVSERERGSERARASDGDASLIKITQTPNSTH